jgi:hypothetical protein
VVVTGGDDVICFEEAARRLGFSAEHVLRLMRAGKLERSDSLRREPMISLSSLVAFERARG